jgi:hypothetical protein
MKEDHGFENFPIWLLGDSNPKAWQDKLSYPLDPRHPAIHNIWTPIADIIQDKIYRQIKERVDFNKIYIRNAVSDPSKKPEQNEVEWTKDLIDGKLESLSIRFRQNNPLIIFSLGAFSFEFARRALGYKDKMCFSHWGAWNLGEEFKKSIETFRYNKTNLIPLLHVSISRGRFIQSHNYFCGINDDTYLRANYFEHVGEALANLFINNRNYLKIWI